MARDAVGRQQIMVRFDDAQASYILQLAKGRQSSIAGAVRTCVNLAIAAHLTDNPAQMALVVPGYAAQVLELAAQQRGISRDKLAQKLLEAVIRDDLVDAVLDDGPHDVGGAAT